MMNSYSHAIQTLYSNLFKAPRDNCTIYLPVRFHEGTGGMIRIEGIKELCSVYNLGLNVKCESEKINTRSPKENLNIVKESLGLSISDLSSIFDVSRPTIYSWLENVEPKGLIAQRLQGLADSAQNIINFKTPGMNRLIRRPIFSGESLFDKIKSDDNITAFLKEFAKIIEKELQNRSVLKGSGNNTRKASEVTSQYSTPIYNERLS